MLVAVWTSMLCCICSVGCLIWVSRSGTWHVDFSWRLRYRHECFFFCVTQEFGYLLFLLVLVYVRCIYNSGYHMSSLCLVRKVLSCSLMYSGYHLCSLRPVLKLHSCLLIIIDFFCYLVAFQSVSLLIMCAF